jgi:hypothetical protein
MMDDAIRKEIDRMKACHDEPFATAIDILEATIVYLIRERDDLELQRKSLKWLAEDRMRKCNVAQDKAAVVDDAYRILELNLSKVIDDRDETRQELKNIQECRVLELKISDSLLETNTELRDVIRRARRALAGNNPQGAYELLCEAYPPSEPQP